MPKIDTLQFNSTLDHVGSWNGGRCKDTLTEKEPDVTAAAITCSVLTDLRNMAEAKALQPKDIQRVIDAFMVSAKVTEVRGPMGGYAFQRAV